MLVRRCRTDLHAVAAWIHAPRYGLYRGVQWHRSNGRPIGPLAWDVLSFLRFVLLAGGRRGGQVQPYTLWKAASALTAAATPLLVPPWVALLRLGPLGVGSAVGSHTPFPLSPSPPFDAWPLGAAALCFRSVAVPPWRASGYCESTVYGLPRKQHERAPLSRLLGEGASGPCRVAAFGLPRKHCVIHYFGGLRLRSLFRNHGRPWATIGVSEVARLVCRVSRVAILDF